MSVPAFLTPGSSIGIVAPAGAISPDLVTSGVQYLEKLGYQVKLGKHLRDNHFQFAATDANRLADLQRMLDDPEIDAILAARGGYGVMRILDQLNLNAFLRFPKWICGFSDITALHCLMSQFNIPTLHSCMLACFSGPSKDDSGSRHLFRFLTGEPVVYEGNSNNFTKPGSIQAPVIGGNLSILFALRGTAYEPDVKGKILFIEDIGEYLYHIDRMMINLKLGGWLEEISGLIIGQFTSVKDHDLGFGLSLDELMHQYYKDLSIPVITNFPSGHIENNMPLLFGKSASMEVNTNQWSLSFD